MCTIPARERADLRWVSPIPVVLTGTIVPNVSVAQEPDWTIRRNQYLEAIAFYKEFSNVYFLENSCYDLAADRAFAGDEKCHVLKFPVPGNPGRGKGYQEFQMLDSFVKDGLTEDRFVKVTGRYLYSNFARLFSFLLEKGQQYDVIIDRLAGRRLALTSLFYTEKRNYLRYFQDAHLEMNDEGHVWAEHVIYARLAEVNAVTFFPATPVLRSAGGLSGPDLLKLKVKNWQRRAFSAFGAGELRR